MRQTSPAWMRRPAITPAKGWNLAGRPARSASQVSVAHYSAHTVCSHAQSSASLLHTDSLLLGNLPR